MVVSLYASLLACIFIYLAVMVIKARRGEKVALGSGDSKVLEQRIRAHANFAEYTPLTLLLMFFLHYQGVEAWVVHVAGIVYVAGRLMHIYGMVFVEKYEGAKLTTTTKYRRYGMVCTFLVLGVCAMLNLMLYVRTLFFA